jgi:hypothetical protein
MKNIIVKWNTLKEDRSMAICFDTNSIRYDILKGYYLNGGRINIYTNVILNSGFIRWKIDDWVKIIHLLTEDKKYHIIVER